VTIDPNHPCAACAVVGGSSRPAGGVLAEAHGLVVHGVAAPSPIAGWVVITSRVHVRAWWELPAAESAALGPLVTRVMRAQREVLGAPHVYALALGDVLHHFHLHLVPRFADTPGRLHGRGAFDFLPSDVLSAEVLEDACARLAAALRADNGARGA
jgi:diadenosine tetraphosphate (Ap4A) HIT family hydrolase